MPRTARLRIPGYPLHVVQRGHNRDRCFFAPNDYILYLALVAENARKHGCAVHSYVLMTNHVHLLLSEIAPWAVTRFMRGVNQRYVQFVNRTYSKTGSLWEGRFHSSIIEDDHHFLACMRYIDLNPVRAGLVRHPAEYPWSAYARNALGQCSAIVEPHNLYLSLGTSDEARRASYRALFEQPFPDVQLEAFRDGIRSGMPVGSDAFLAHLSTRLGRNILSRRKATRQPHRPHGHSTDRQGRDEGPSPIEGPSLVQGPSPV